MTTGPIARNREPPPWLVAALLTLLLRLFYSALAALLTPHLRLDPRAIQSNRLTEHLMQRSEGLLYALLGVWERFDTLWYVHIAQHGYDRPEAVVFFPLYPLLLRLVSALTGQPLAAALLVSTAATFFLFWGFQKLLLLDLPRDLVTRAVVLYAVWPASFIFFCGYADSLVIALIIWSIYFARRGWWWWSGLTGCFAGLAKAVGALVIVPQAIVAWRARNWRASAIALALLGSASFTLWLKLTGRLLPSEAYPQHWDTYPAWPWVTLWNSLLGAWTGETVPAMYLRLHLALLLLTAVLALLRFLRPEYTLYLVVALCFILAKNAVPSQQQWTRWCLILFVAPVNLGALPRSRAAYLLSVVLLFLVNVYFVQAFLEWSLAI